MATVEERYQAATAYVRGALAAVPDHGVSYVVDPVTGLAQWFAVQSRVSAIRGELACLAMLWLRAATDAQRVAVADAAEALAQHMLVLARRRGDTRNAIIETPGSIKAEMDTVRGIIQQLDHDIAASAVPDDFKLAWKKFVAEYERFYKDHEGWTDRVWYSSYEKTVEYRKQAQTWREKFKALGGRPAAPDDVLPTTPTDTIKSLGKWALLGGAAWLGLKAIEAVGMFRLRNDSDDDERMLNGALEAAATRNARRSYYVRMRDTDLYYRVVRDNGGQFVLLVPLADDARDAIADREAQAVTMPDGTEGEAYRDRIARYERVSRLPRKILQ